MDIEESNEIRNDELLAMDLAQNEVAYPRLVLSGAVAATPPTNLKNAQKRGEVELKSQPTLGHQPSRGAVAATPLVDQGAGTGLDSSGSTPIPS